jgi:hypothetical protein
MLKGSRVNLLALLGTGMLPFLSGCPKVPEASPKAAAILNRDSDDAPRTVSTLMEFKIDEPIRIVGCFARIARLAEGGAGVLVVSSTENDTTVVSPAILIRARISVSAPAELLDLTLPAQLFVQGTADGEVWSTPPGQPVELRILAADEMELRGEIKGEVVSSDGSRRSKANGTFTALIRRL